MVFNVSTVVSSKKIVVLTKNGCKYCDQMKEVLEKELGIDMEQYVRVENLQEPKEKFVQKAEEMIKLTGSKTFPQLFLGGKYFGGTDDLRRMQVFNQDKLHERFADIGVNIDVVDF